MVNASIIFNQLKNSQNKNGYKTIKQIKDNEGININNLIFKVFIFSKIKVYKKNTANWIPFNTWKINGLTNNPTKHSNNFKLIENRWKKFINKKNVIEEESI